MEGLKVGLEIHQQLAGKKLFCSCPAEVLDEEPDLNIKRKLRAVIGETGQVDIAAARELAKGKTFLYYFHDKVNCLVDIDEEPPHSMNQEALETALMVAKIVKAKVVDEIQVMRKIVIDGSNVTGFQRTALVATDGYIETSEGKITVPTICLEEDAAKIVERKGDTDIYDLSRLGIPLIEISTGPDIKTPEGAKEAAEKLGMILRSTKRVKRGLGTIRQDVNVSIPAGQRIEVKGAQDLKLVPQLVKYEMQRQETLVKIKDELKFDTIENKQVDVTDLFKKTEAKLIKQTLDKKGVVFALKLQNFAGFLGRETQPGKRLGTELSGYAKVAAGVGGLFHSDELPKYGITKEEVDAIKKKLNCKEADAFVIIADQKNKVIKALDAVVERANRIKEGVIKEVRNALPDATTAYLRPIPGAARMYPETDVPPVKADTSEIEVPELIEEKSKRIEEYGLSKDLADLLSKSNRVEVFENFVDKFKNLKPAFIAETMLPKMREIKRKHEVDTDNVDDSHLEQIFQKLDTGEIAKEAVEEIIIAIAKGEEIDWAKYKGASDEEIEAEIKKIVDANKGAPIGALMGQCMAKFRGKVDGKKVNEILKKLVG